MKSLLLIVLAGVFLALAGCREPDMVTDSNLPASGAPQSWEQTMPGMSGMNPGDN
ncbi:MAG: hypothetical protein K6B46_03835 [Opitutales bacterium]|nr:hypothetical protein [Opitutales bacterium]